MTEPQIVQTLRSGPKVSAPSNLLQTLRSDIRLPEQVELSVPWWRRWTPALSFGVLIGGGFVLLGVQQVQLNEARRQKERLQQEVSAKQATTDSTAATAVETAGAQKRREEVESLRAEIERLTQSAAQLASLKRQSEQLRSQLTASVATAAAADPFAEQKAKAQRTACISNIKQLALAAIMWANDNNNVFPPDFSSMKNQLRTPGLLTCPGDKAGQPSPRSWDDLNPAAVSYEWLAPGQPVKNHDQVIIRCRIHANAALADGSAHQLRDQSMYVAEDGIIKIRPLQGDYE